MPRALITGATGLVGSAIAERLLADGWAVRALVRAPERAAWLAAEGVELHPGDILDAPSFERAACGCGHIFHCAALIISRGGWEEYRRLNIEGTHSAIDAAERSGARLVQISSVAVYGPSARYDGERPTTEDSELAPLPPRAFYARSKRESEQAVLAAHASGRIWATAVRPDVIYGDRDRQFVPRIARVLARGVIAVPGRGTTTLPVVHATNVADGAVRAATADVAGGRVYNLANDHDVTGREFIRLAGEGLGRRIRVLWVPAPAARAGVAIVRPVARWLGGQEIALSLAASIDFFTRDNPFSSARARRELGWTTPVHPRDGIPSAFRRWARRRRSGTGAA